MPINHELLEKPLVAGEYWYMINKEWWKRWKNVICDQKNCNQSTLVDPLSNANLIDASQNDIAYDRPIIKKIVEKSKDYMLIHEDLWNYMHSRFGGGPPIPCTVISLYKKLVVEVYPLMFDLIVLKQDDTIKIIKAGASRSETILSLKERILKSFKVDDTPNYKLYYNIKYQVGNLITNYYKDFATGEILLNTVNNAHIFSNQLLVLSPYSRLQTYKILKNSSQHEFFQNSQNTDSIQPLGGTIGLYNLGNTCFLNVILQCLAHIPVFVNYFLTSSYKVDINFNNPLGHKGVLANEFEKIVRALWYGDVKAEIPRKFTSVLRKIAPQFEGAEEHDAHEFMTFLLDGLHEDLSRVQVKQNIKDPEFHSGADLKASGEEAWNLYLKRNDSIIVDLFQGLLKSQIVCNTCRYDSIRFDPFMYLALPFPNIKRAIKIKIVTNSKVIDSLILADEEETFEQAMEEVCSSLQLSVANFVIADISKNSIQKFYSLNDKISETSKTNALVAYEIIYYPEMPKIQQILIKVSQNLVSWCDLDKGKFTWTPYDYPFVLYVPRKIKLTQLEEYLKNRLNQLIVSPDEYLNKNFILCKIDSSTRQPLLLVEEKEYIEFLADEELGIYWDKHLAVCETELPRFQKPILHPRYKKNKEQSVSPISIYNCLKAFSEKEILSEENGYNCPRCKKPQAATRTLELWRVPEIFIVHLKRFKQISIYIREKIDLLVEFPLKNLEIVVNDVKYSYSLFAYSNHIGLVSVGHYTAQALNHLTGRWYHFNDEIVTEVDKKDHATSSSAYILFYELEKSVEQKDQQKTLRQ